LESRKDRRSRGGIKENDGGDESIVSNFVNSVQQ
jgi:hypothetical protein